MSGLLTRLEVLERAVSALAAQAGGGETLVPNSYSVDNQGNVKVTGLIIPASATVSTVSARNQIQWQQSGGAAVAAIVGYGTGAAGTVRALELDSLAIDATDESQTLLQAKDDTGNVQGALFVSQQARGSALVQVLAGPNQFTLLDAAGESKWLQLAAGASQKAIAFGTGTFNGNGTSSVGVTQAHGLGRAPNVAFATGDGWQGYMENDASPDATNLHLGAHNTGGNFTNATGYFFFWIAIG